MSIAAARSETPVEYASPPVVTDEPASPEPVTRSAAVPELPREDPWKRRTFLLIAILISVAYLAFVLVYWTPSHQGVDQNGYLVGGKMFAETLSMKQVPMKLGQPDQYDPHQFVGNMWVAAASNPRHYYPKYPLGLPFLYAISLWVGGASYGVMIAHLLSPVSMAATVFGVFLLTRQFAGSFPGVLAMLIFATSPTTSALVINPNSHATTVFCVVFGMICLLHWWRLGGWGWALVGGLLVGYAATIRYTEGALLLPLAWAALLNLRWRRLRGWIESSLVLVGWAIPVALLLLYNKLEMGTLTGYDGTNESTGFSWVYFYDNWETILRQLSENGLFLIFPISIAGLIAMFWWNWRLAVLMWLWIGPCLTIYTFYYWAPDGLGYLRFLLTVLPPMLVGGFWVIAHLRDLLPKEPIRVNLYVVMLTITLGAFAAAALGSYGLRLDLAALSERIKGTPPAEAGAPVPTPKVVLQPLPVYFDEENNPGEVWIARSIFTASLVMLAAWGGAISASALARQSVVPTLAAGVVGFLSIAVQADNSAIQLERESYTRNTQQVTHDLIRKLVPDGAVLICKDEGTLHQMQFVGNWITYTGLTFDRNWLSNRRRPGAEVDPHPLDPTRMKQLDELKALDQATLTADARTMLRDALNARRRVFVVEPLVYAELQKTQKEKKDPPMPEFVRRYVSTVKDKSLQAKPVTFWTVPMVAKELPPAASRGRRDRRPAYRMSCYQVWEITAPT